MSGSVVKSAQRCTLVIVYFILIIDWVSCVQNKTERLVAGAHF